jgi:hypothetical protein
MWSLEIGTYITDQVGIQCAFSSPVRVGNGDQLVGDATGTGISLMLPPTSRRAPRSAISCCDPDTASRLLPHRDLL